MLPGEITSFSLFGDCRTNLRESFASKAWVKMSRFNILICSLKVFPKHGGIAKVERKIIINSRQINSSVFYSYMKWFIVKISLEWLRVDFDTSCVSYFVDTKMKVDFEVGVVTSTANYTGSTSCLFSVQWFWKNSALLSFVEHFLF